MAVNYDNDICRIAAQMLDTEPDLLDYRLIEYLDEIDSLVHIVGEHVASRQIVALAIVTWRHDKADDFTGKPQIKNKGLIGRAR